MVKKDRRYPSEEQDRFMVRLPDGMRDKIEKAAKAAKRTMNSEIVARLEWSFEKEIEPAEKGLKFIRAGAQIGDRMHLRTETRLAKLEREVAELKKSRS